MLDPNSRDRGVSPVIGTVLLVLVTILLVAVVGTTIVGSTSLSPVHQPVALSATATSDGTITLTHDGGAPILVDGVDVRISVDGEPLASQPPVPFFASEGFASGPTGPFNRASDDEWSVGETATLTLAATNRPRLDAGSNVEVRVIRGEQVIATAETSVLGDASDGDEG